MHPAVPATTASAFLAAQAILGCMIAQNLTGSILTTLAANWPIVLAILLVTLLSSAIVGWLLVRYSSLPGNTGAWGSSPGGAAAMVAMAQDYGADIRLVAGEKSGAGKLQSNSAHTEDDPGDHRPK